MGKAPRDQLGEPKKQLMRQTGKQRTIYTTNNKTNTVKQQQQKLKITLENRLL
jgi:hypothetical protein